MLRRLFGHALLASFIAVSLVVGVVVAAGLGQRGQAAVEPAGENPGGVADGGEIPGRTETGEFYGSEELYGSRDGLGRTEPTEEHVRPAADGTWVSGWTASPTGGEPDNPEGLPDQSVRNVLAPTIGGSAVRVEISNRYGTGPLRITHATVALAAEGGPEALPRSMRRLTFAGEPVVSIPAGGSVLSDGTALEVPEGAELLVTVYAPQGAGPVTYHRRAQQISFLAAGDRAGEEGGGSFGQTITDWRYVTAVQLLNAEVAGAVAVLGDSLTDGITSAVGANQRWTDLLAQRLRTAPDTPRYAVLNAGISGNRLLRDADPDRPFNGAAGLRRMHTDVLPQSGVRSLVVQLGINDLIRDPESSDAAAVLEGLRLLTEEAREAGLWVVGATLTPFEGHARWDREREAVRQQINEAIRGGEVFDAVVDLDAVLHDPARPSRLRPAYDSGDGLHPADAGYAAMATAVDLTALVPDEAALL